jgi:hypothetical protein
MTTDPHPGLIDTFFPPYGDTLAAITSAAFSQAAGGAPSK